MSNLTDQKPLSFDRLDQSVVSKKRLFIKTFGCQMNEYDSDKMARVLESEYERVAEPDQADLVLINTCSVRDKPEQKLYSWLGEMRGLKKTKGDMLIGVGGCVAQQQGAEILKYGRGVDFVFGTHNLSLIPSLIEARHRTARPQVAVDYREDWEDLPIGFAQNEPTRVSALVSISRGCNKNCSYCIVPTTRGREVSRSVDEIEREVRLAVHRGAREVVLLGQTVNSYGLDLNPKVSFVELLSRLAQFDNLLRIRFTSPHPQEVRQDFFDAIATNPKVCHHIHMPLQSGSDRILKLMNRNYRRKKYLEIIGQLRARVPNISFTTDIIVGFPGETEQDFEQTLEIMELVRFDNSYSFMFSPRPGTKAAVMPQENSPEDMLRRLQRLQLRQEEITTERLKTFINSQVEVLVEGPSSNDPTRAKGRISQNITFNFLDQNLALTPGMLVKATVTSAARFTLKGEARLCA